MNASSARDSVNGAARYRGWSSYCVRVERCQGEDHTQSRAEGSNGAPRRGEDHDRDAGRRSGSDLPHRAASAPKRLQTRLSGPSAPPIPAFVAPRYGDTPDEDRAFRREMLLDALTDALFRLRCHQLHHAAARASQTTAKG